MEEEKYIQNTERNIARREGQAEAKLEMTINLLKENNPIEKIVNVTGLSEEEIKK